MSHHKNKRVLVGVTGGIAAYKSPELVRRLKDRGCDVRVVMSRAAEAFITPLTMQAVSGHPVHQHLLDAEAESGMGHIELARWAELVVIAPATANFIAKLAHGQADDLLSTLALATEAEVAVAPAMNQQMWQHPSTGTNLEQLVQRGIRVIGPGSGDQACGEVGPGRMTEPEEIAGILAGDAIEPLLSDCRVLITAGPTWEAIDPVRGVTNHSSGKMGYALAQAASDFGAQVTLISGPVHLDTPQCVSRIDVLSAADMLESVMREVGKSNIFIAVAAVADYRPADVAAHKIKKSEDQDGMVIEMVKNPDILATVAALEKPPFT
ncbi:MAG: bifunctional phosphopantothenoylcysteine decarboxylase/phosphopantothenate--cysteine ligase CoaBC, partial [Arenicellales bacterium]